jgi:sigma-B regulation protein RsbQ
MPRTAPTVKGPARGAAAVLERNNVHVSGVPDGDVLMFAHGFGCDQTMWRHVAAAFEPTHRVVCFDHVGSGGSDLAAHDRERYSTLHGYADDVLQIIDALALTGVTYVGHSVGAMIGVLAVTARPAGFARLVVLGASPRYIDEEGYTGGFSAGDIDDLLEALDRNFEEWSKSMVPVVMGAPDRPDLQEELQASFLHSETEIAQHFGRVTFLSDHRADVARVSVPTLILQAAGDAIVPPAVAEYLHRAIPGSRLVWLEATGHYPLLTGPPEVARQIRGFL